MAGGGGIGDAGPQGSVVGTSSNDVSKIYQYINKPADMKNLANMFPDANETELKAIYAEFIAGNLPDIFKTHTSPRTGAGILDGSNLYQYTNKPADGILDGSIQNSTAPPASSAPPAETTSATASSASSAPPAETTGATTDSTDDITALLKIMREEKVKTADPSTVPESELRDLIKSTAERNVNVDPEQARLDEEERQRVLATAAYEMSPEMKAAYARLQQESDAYYAAQLDPKRLRAQKINALLKGLGSSNSIAESGIAALEGTTAVDDNAMEARRQQTEGRFANLKEQEGINRESRTAAYGAGREAGQSAYERASAGVNQALQTLAQLATSQETAALDMVYKDYEMSMGVLSNQLAILMSREKLAADEQNVARQILSDTRRSISLTESTIAELKGQAIFANDENAKNELNAIIFNLEANNVELQNQVDQILPKLNITPGQTGGRDTGSAPPPPAAFILD